MSRVTTHDAEVLGRATVALVDAVAVYLDHRNHTAMAELLTAARGAAAVARTLLARLAVEHPGAALADPDDHARQQLQRAAAAGDAIGIQRWHERTTKGGDR